jgi:hypothetical protein
MCEAILNKYLGRDPGTCKGEGAFPSLIQVGIISGRSPELMRLLLQHFCTGWDAIPEFISGRYSPLSDGRIKKIHSTRISVNDEWMHITGSGRFPDFLTGFFRRIAVGINCAGTGLAGALS